MSQPVIVVVGAGPGVGASVARRYGREGYAAGLVSLPAEDLEKLGQQLQSEGVTTGWAPVDVTDQEGLTEAIKRFGGFAEGIDVLHFNPSAFRQKDLLELGVDELLEDVALGVGGLLTAVQAARPFMRAGARITATGSMAADEPWHEAATLGVQKAGLRNLVRSIDARLSPEGVRAVSVTVRGTLGKGTPFDADYVADALYAAAHQDEDSWRTEVPFTGGPTAT